MSMYFYGMTPEEAHDNYIEEQAYKRGYEDAKKEFDRPHGEWKPSWNNLNESYCSHCNFTVRNELRSYFCPKCGSDNRKRGKAVRLEGKRYRTKGE